jgi:hypothetical protein
MSKQHVVVKDDHPLRETHPGALEAVAPPAFASSFLRFTFSVTEVSSVGGRTRVRSSTTRLADGRLTSEKFDGELEGGAYERWMQQASDQFAAQLRLLFQPFSWFLPPRDGAAPPVEADGGPGAGNHR